MAEHTSGPWVGFSDQGKCIAIMAAGRAGDVCTFKQPPSDADAQLMTAAPDLVKGLKRARMFIDLITKHAELQSGQPALGGRQELAEIDAILSRVGTGEVT